MTALLSRRRALALAGGGLAAVGGAGAADLTKLSFSYQRSSALLIMLMAHGTLAGDLAKAGYRPVFTEFDRILDAMTANVVTFHGDVADAVPIFSQAAGAALAYYAMEKGSPAAEALIVHDASPARSVADLRGRTVAVSKGSGAHYMLVGLLKRAGLAQGDVRIAFLEASLASAAFSTGTVDAWAIWDPYLAITEARTKVRVLGEGTGITSYNRYYLADAAFVRAHPEVVEIVYAALAGQAAAIRAQPQPYAAELSPYWDHVSPEIVARIDARRGYRIQPVDAAAMAEQQRIADLFVSMQLIPEAIRVAETPVWRPRSA